MAITEYNLVKSGVTDYERLGYGTDVYKLLEYLTIDAAMADAMDERGKR